MKFINDGEGIDIEMHPEHKIYVPELIFGNLLTSANYEKKNKTTGGKNGYGAKLTNIFSKEFIIETVDSSRKRHYRQVFTNNMLSKEKPKITNKYIKKPFTKISYRTDLEQFSMKEISEDVYALLQKRVFDMAACTDKTVNVYFNDNKLEFKDFEKYLNSYIGPKSETKRVYEQFNDRWEIAVCLSPDDKFEHVSFVNGICTYKGGEHIDYIAKTVSTKLSKYVEKKNIKKKISLKPSILKDNMFIFARTIIEDPSFDSQTKENMTTPPNKFGSKFTIDDKFLEKLSKTGVVEKAIAFSEYKDSTNLKKISDGAKTKNVRIPKLDDANWAGTNKSGQCTLILTEGDSAKAFAISGLGIIGRDKYGVFPLKGKLLNVRDASPKQVSANDELNNINKILGLKHGKVYESLTELRYGSIMILTDADLDGSHIKGLLINMFHNFWPSLLKHEGFLKSMITPIIKAQHKKTVKEFYTMIEYDDWKNKDDRSKWSIKYYKGLGTSTSKEAKDYFKKLDDSEVNYVWDDDNEVNSNVELAFSKNNADLRKKWLESYDKNEILDYTDKNISIGDLINKDLKHFSKYDCERSVPSIVDGLKPGQRKVIYAVIKRNLQKSIKVAQLSAYVSEKTNYHHGEESLNLTIINLAANYVGSNNINLLVPEGQFGTRLQGGKDHASPRYIFTKMNQILPYIFNEHDNNILNYLDDDGDPIEPEWFVPCIPMVLVNGVDGIGTGFSSKIPCYNPLDIIKNLRKKMKGEELDEMMPWYRGFTGKIEYEDDKNEKIISKGMYRTVKNNSIEIYELPIGKWTDNYKNFLDSLIIEKGDKNNKSQVLVDYESQYTESTVRFILKFKNTELSKMLMGGKFESNMKLIDYKRTSTTNMHLFNKDGQIKKYDSPNKILEEFYDIRREYYEKRKDYLEKKIKRELDIIKSKVRFILGILNDEIILKNKDEEEISEELEKMNFPKFTKGKLEYDQNNENSNPSYDYLIGMQIRAMTKKRVEELKQQEENKEGGV